MDPITTLTCAAVTLFIGGCVSLYNLDLRVRLGVAVKSDFILVALVFALFGVMCWLVSMVRSLPSC